MILAQVVMIRRLKEEVLSDMLPEKDRQMVDVPCDAEIMKEVCTIIYFRASGHRALGRGVWWTILVRCNCARQSYF